MGSSERINIQKASNIEQDCQLYFKSNYLAACFLMVTESAEYGVNVVILKFSSLFSTVVDLQDVRGGEEGV